MIKLDVHICACSVHVWWMCWCKDHMSGVMHRRAVLDSCAFWMVWNVCKPFWTSACETKWHTEIWIANWQSGMWCKTIPRLLNIQYVSLETCRVLLNCTHSELSSYLCVSVFACCTQHARLTLRGGNLWMHRAELWCLYCWEDDVCAWEIRESGSQEERHGRVSWTCLSWWVIDGRFFFGLLVICSLGLPFIGHSRSSTTQRLKQTMWSKLVNFFLSTHKWCSQGLRVGLDILRFHFILKTRSLYSTFSHDWGSHCLDVSSATGWHCIWKVCARTAVYTVLETYRRCNCQVQSTKSSREFISMLLGWDQWCRFSLYRSSRKLPVWIVKKCIYRIKCQNQKKKLKKTSLVANVHADEVKVSKVSYIQVCLHKLDTFKPESGKNQTIFGRRTPSRQLKLRSCKPESAINRILLTPNISGLFRNICTCNNTSYRYMQRYLHRRMQRCT